MIAIGISEEARFRHEKANHFCLEVLKNCLILDRFNLVEYNNKEPGVILYTEDWASGSHYAEIRKNFRNKNVDSYLDIKRYKSSIHVLLKKEYIDQIEDLETMLKLQDFWESELVLS